MRGRIRFLVQRLSALCALDLVPSLRQLRLIQPPFSLGFDQKRA